VLDLFNQFQVGLKETGVKPAEAAGEQQPLRMNAFQKYPLLEFSGITAEFLAKQCQEINLGEGIAADRAAIGPVKLGLAIHK